jgi:hypothetical protein
LVGVGEPRLSWSEKVEARQEMELEACKRERKEQCEQLVEQARQRASQGCIRAFKNKSKHKKGGVEAKHKGPPVMKQRGNNRCCPGCSYQKMKMWDKELSSLT